MGYRLRNVKIENFKYIEYGRPIEIILENYDMIILDGPNGYGKSTFFDAIELLITGTIKHFNENLPNRGKESLTILANNQNYDVTITAVFYNEDTSYDNLIVKRIFKCRDNFNNNIYLELNDYQQEIDQEKLYKILGINKNMFDIGVYISQSESLEFLQQKYKERKEQITSILDNSEILRKIQSIKSFRDAFKDKCDLQLSILEKEKVEVKDKIEMLTKSIDELKDDSEVVSYQKLFENEFDFDKELIDTTKSYEATIQPLKDLELFIEDYSEYIKALYNTNIEKIIKMQKNEFIALYFKLNIDEIKSERNKVMQLKRIKEYLPKFEAKSYIYDEEIFNFLCIDEKTSKNVKKLINEKQSAEKQLSDNQKLLKEILEKRSQLFVKYHSAIDHGLLDKSHCPFCGSQSDNIETLFENTTKQLKENMVYSHEQILKIDTSLNGIFNNAIIPLVKMVLHKEENLIYNYDILNFYTSIDTGKLKKILDDIKISDFYNKIDKVDIDVFEKDYSVLLDKLMEMKKTVEKMIPEHQIDMYKMIHAKYYNNRESIHKVVDIQNKKYYIIDQYFNKYNQEFIKYSEIYKGLSDKYDVLKQKIDGWKKSISDLFIKYDETYKQYQTDLVHCIKVPLFLLSGRIIQNYPLGLGISIDVKDNQVVFKADKKDGDIFNILSMGQLNGVVLSILLSVKSVFTNQSSLNMLLIDDPLQSIDDISAYSFSDVLAEQFGDTQVIISTHEDDKSNLFKFKHRQLGLKSQAFNMQKFFLSN